MAVQNRGKNQGALRLLTILPSSHTKAMLTMRPKKPKVIILNGNANGPRSLMQKWAVPSISPARTKVCHSKGETVTPGTKI